MRKYQPKQFLVFFVCFFTLNFLPPAHAETGIERWNKFLGCPEPQTSSASGSAAAPAASSIEVGRSGADLDIHNLCIDTHMPEAESIRSHNSAMEYKVTGNGEFSSILLEETQDHFYTRITKFFDALTARDQSDVRIPVGPMAYRGFLRHISASFTSDPALSTWRAEDSIRAETLLKTAAMLQLSDERLYDAEGRAIEVTGETRLNIQNLSDTANELQRTIDSLKAYTEQLFGRAELLDHFSASDLVALSSQALPETDRIEVVQTADSDSCIVLIGSACNGGLLNDGAAILPEYNAYIQDDSKLKGRKSLWFSSPIIMARKVQEKVVSFLAPTEAQETIRTIEGCVQSGKKILVKGHGINGAAAMIIADRIRDYVLEYNASDSIRSRVDFRGIPTNDSKLVKTMTFGALSAFPGQSVARIRERLSGNLLRFERCDDTTAAIPYASCIGSRDAGWLGQHPIPENPAINLPEVPGLDRDKPFFRTSTRNAHLAEHYQTRADGSGGMLYFIRLAALQRSLEVERELLSNIIVGIKTLSEERRLGQIPEGKFEGKLNTLIIRTAQAFTDLYDVRKNLIVSRTLNPRSPEDVDFLKKSRQQTLSVFRTLTEKGRDLFGRGTAVVSMFSALQNEQLTSDRFEVNEAQAKTVLESTSASLEDVIKAAKGYFGIFRKQYGTHREHYQTLVEHHYKESLEHINHLNEQSNFFGEIGAAKLLRFQDRVRAYRQSFIEAGLQTAILGRMTPTESGLTGTTYLIKSLRPDLPPFHTGEPIGVFKQFKKLEKAGLLTRLMGGQAASAMKDGFGQKSRLSSHPGAEVLNEVLAFRLAMHMGVEHLVPISTLAGFPNEAGEIIRGDFMEFIGPAYAATRSADQIHAEDEGELIDFQKAFVFDFLIGNLDRHLDNLYLRNQAHGDAKYISPIMLIDNANAFPISGLSTAHGSTAGGQNMFSWGKFTLSERPFHADVRTWWLAIESGVSGQHRRKPKDLTRYIQGITDSLQGDQTLLDTEASQFLELRIQALTKLMRQADSNPRELSRLKTKAAIRRFQSHDGPPVEVDEETAEGL